MPLIAKAPHIKLLEAGVATLEAVDDWEETTGIAIAKVRHGRNRGFTDDETPGIGLFWRGNRLRDPEDRAYVAGETVKLCDIDMMIELEPPTEESGDDESGWEMISRVQARAFQALRDPDSPLMLLCDWIESGDEEPDEDSRPDDERLVKALSVVYRVRTDDENVLLAMGEQA